ncbi:hypothetical protein BGX28_007536 [Mortierella sp. GBA30]|nr:hypothetical protein BGX28_007536 [Mortierella sp. GBA30]
MAVPKGPPQDPWSLAQRLPVKGILKKRSSDTSVNGEGRGGAGGPGMVTSAALAGAGGDDDTKGDIKPGDSSTSSSIGVTSDVAAQLHNPAPVSAATARRPSALASEDIHPMATPDMGLDAIKLLTSTDHRARLVTNSPPPAHPHKAPLPPPLALDSKAPTDLAGEQDGVIKVPLVGGAGSPPPGSNSTSNGSNNKDSESAVTGTKAFTPVSQGAALPPDYFTPGMQSNLHKDRGDGERTRGAVVRDEISQDELLTQQMLTLSARAQDLANQYYDPRISNGSSGQGAIQGGLGGSSGGGGGLMVPGAGGQQGGPKRRSINFLDKIEIIPAHRKSEYNRSSDKHATFRILTPDLKSEIRDELNTYKMREMAVHVESMGNTAFH